MSRIKNILQVVMFVSLLILVGGVATRLALVCADPIVFIPAIAAVWSGLAWFGIRVIENSK